MQRRLIIPWRSGLVVLQPPVFTKIDWCAPLPTPARNNLRLDFYIASIYLVWINIGWFSTARTWVACLSLNTKRCAWVFNHRVITTAKWMLMADMLPTPSASLITMVRYTRTWFYFEIQRWGKAQTKLTGSRLGTFYASEHGAKPKPRYWALRMLDSLGPQRPQVLGQGSAGKSLATKDRSREKFRQFWRTLTEWYQSRNGANHLPGNWSRHFWAKT